MKNKVVFKKSDFLWSISELVGFNPNERLNWVQKTNFDTLVNCNYLVHTFNFAEGDSVIAPVYAVVKALHNNKAGFPTMNKGYNYDIISVDFASDLNVATALINREATTPFVPFLYMWSWDKQAFEKVDYNLGYYRYYEEDEVAQEMRAKDFDIEFNLGVTKEYFEEGDGFDLYNENEDVFIEIPDVYEFTYFEEVGEQFNPEKEVLKFKNINTAVNEAVFTMYELGYEETVIENSWVVMTVFADWNLFEERKEPVVEGEIDCNDWIFLKCCFVHVLFKYTEHYKAAHPLNDYIENRISLDGDCENCCMSCICNGDCDMTDEELEWYADFTEEDLEEDNFECHCCCKKCKLCEMEYDEELGF